MLIFYQLAKAKNEFLSWFMQSSARPPCSTWLSLMLPSITY